MKDISKKYLLLSFITFLLFMLEYLALGVIEPFFLGSRYEAYSSLQKGGHWLFMVVLWGIAIRGTAIYSKRLGEQTEELRYKKKQPINWLIVSLLLLVCKVITYLDWGTLKIIGEFYQKNNVYLFVTQYLYYVVEVYLVLLIVVYAQKAFDLWCGSQSTLPIGGLFLALTWGAFHFISTGGDFWNGLSCMIFSLMAGQAYLSLNKNKWAFYLFISCGYLV